MNITPQTKIKEILDACPELIPKLPQLDSRLGLLKNPIGLAMAGKFTLADAAKKAGMTETDLIAKVKQLAGIK